MSMFEDSDDEYEPVGARYRSRAPYSRRGWQEKERAPRNPSRHFGIKNDMVDMNEKVEYMKERMKSIEGRMDNFRSRPFGARASDVDIEVRNCS